MRSLHFAFHCRSPRKGFLPRRRKLRIARFAASGKTHSLRCSSSPHKAGFAGAREAVVSRPLAGPVRSAEGYPLLQAAPAMQPFTTSSSSLSAYRKRLVHPADYRAGYGCLRKPVTNSFSAEEHEKLYSLKS